MKKPNKDFLHFVAECRRWLAYFGLFGWDVHFAECEDAECPAFCMFNDTLQDRVVAINFDTSEKYTPEFISMVAFHEVLEILLFRMRKLAEERYVMPEEVSEEIHNLIRIFENTVWKDLMKVKK